MIKNEHIYKTFDGKEVLSDVSFTLSPGEITALVGENGAGKSTLMRIMCNYLNADSGTVEVFGYDIAKDRLRALSVIGYVPEISSLYGDMSVYDFLFWAAGIREVKDRDKAILDVAQQMQIMDVLEQKCDTLSKGFKKRTEIASALLHKPRFLILDEPTDGLDPNQKQDIRNFMRGYAKNNIVLVSTHVLEDAESADRVIMLAHGKILKDTNIADFKKVSKHKDIREAFRILSKKEK